VDGVAECMFEMLPRVLGWPLVGCQRLFLAGPYGGGQHEAMVIRSDNGTLEPSLPHLSIFGIETEKQKTEMEMEWNMSVFCDGKRWKLEYVSGRVRHFRSFCFLLVGFTRFSVDQA